MNDVYLTLKPIYEHYKISRTSPDDFINRFQKYYHGCYCCNVHKIVINTRYIEVDNVDINMIIDHEVIHHILDKYFNDITRKQFDNINLKLEEYLWLKRQKEDEIKYQIDNKFNHN